MLYEIICVYLTYLERRHKRHHLADETDYIYVIGEEITETLLERICEKIVEHIWRMVITSFVAKRLSRTTVPTTTLKKAAIWLACFAARALRDPIKFPTRVDAATPVKLVNKIHAGRGSELLTDTEGYRVKD